MLALFLHLVCHMPNILLRITDCQIGYNSINDSSMLLLVAYLD
uniref:Uncharacterized protein n=1 Tax=Arundo donax TaxID=35708 RepID=A0A0A8Y214_ARUDO